MKRRTRVMRPTRSTVRDYHLTRSHTISHNLAFSMHALQSTRTTTPALIHALAVPAGHGVHADHHAAGPGPSGTTSSPPGTPADAFPRCWCMRVREAHERSPRGDLPAAAAATSGAPRAARLPRALLLPLQPCPAAAHAHALPSVAPALPHAAAAPSHTPHVQHVVVWPMATGAACHPCPGASAAPPAQWARLASCPWKI